MIRILLFVALTLSGFAQKQPAVTVPKSAVELSPGVYRHVDESGKAWTYRKTPFGVTKTAGEPKAESPATKSAPDTKQETPFGDVKETKGHQNIVSVVEDGDSLRFERASPFGPYKWTKKKSDLSAAEKEAWERAKTGTKQ